MTLTNTRLGTIWEVVERNLRPGLQRMIISYFYFCKSEKLSMSFVKMANHLFYNINPKQAYLCLF
jgi:hypothetical protein